jgi:hypothetical protein
MNPPTTKIHGFGISAVTYYCREKNNLFPEIYGCPHKSWRYTGRLWRNGFYERNWLSTYRRYGLEGVKKQLRSDRGHFRCLTAEAQQLIKEILKASPKRPAVAVYQDVLAANLTNPPSLSTVQRFIKQTKDALVEPEIERCRFANDCWQSDVCIDPYLLLDGKKKKTYLVAILDDASRLIVHSEFFFEESYLNESDAAAGFSSTGDPHEAIR